MFEYFELGVNDGQFKDDNAKQGENIKNDENESAVFLNVI